MYQTVLFAVIVLTLGFSACKKTPITEDPSNRLSFSQNELVFDTVFSSRSTVTRRFQVFNKNSRDLLIEEIRLMGADESSYRINIDGNPNNSEEDYRIAANDSFYIFVEATIDPNNDNQPFVVLDSIRFSYNNNRDFIKLKSWGRNAEIYNRARISGVETWQPGKPILIVDYVIVDSNSTLNILPGTEVYLTGGSGLYVFGSLQINYNNGNYLDAETVSFSGDRVEEDYEELPGQYYGIRLLPSSAQNVINNLHLSEASIGITVDSLSNDQNPKLIMRNSIIENVSTAAVQSFTGDIFMVNCILSNTCGNLFCSQFGGNYQFVHCNFDNSFCDCGSQNPAIVMANDPFINPGISEKQFDLNASIINSIIWGEFDDEIGFVELKQNDMLVLSNNIIKASEEQGLEERNIINNDPTWVDNCNLDFNLEMNSPALNSGISLTQGAPSIIDQDFSGNTRNRESPDIGAIEQN